jgi:hypothetical protein
VPTTYTLSQQFSIQGDRMVSTEGGLCNSSALPQTRGRSGGPCKVVGSFSIIGTGAPSEAVEIVLLASASTTRV